MTVYHENAALLEYTVTGCHVFNCVAIATKDLTSGGCHRNATDKCEVLWINRSLPDSTLCLPFMAWVGQVVLCGYEVRCLRCMVEYMSSLG